MFALVRSFVSGRPTLRRPPILVLVSGGLAGRVGAVVLCAPLWPANLPIVRLALLKALCFLVRQMFLRGLARPIDKQRFNLLLVELQQQAIEIGRNTLLA